MKKAFLFICMLIALNAWSQKDKFNIKLNVPALFDMVNSPNIQVGIEARLSPRIGWFNELGVRYSNYSSRYSPGDTSFLSPYGFKAKSEIRYYFQKIASKINIKVGKKAPVSFTKAYYAAANLFFIRDVHNNATSYYFNKDTSQLRNDGYGVKKTIWGFNFIFGVQEPLGKRIFIDLYVGLGVRFRYITTTNIEYKPERDGLIGSKDLSIVTVDAITEGKGGFSVAPNINLGGRLCYRL